MEHQVIHDPERHRFLVHELGHEAYLSYYELPDKVLDLAETQTPNEIRGRGIATAMIRFALDYARQHGYRVVPGCPFVRTYIDRHPQFADLLADRPVPRWE
ncbi:MAG: N-acetyltransferase [Spirochaetaceae bacterium]|nr:MAG: N-acetyltransferase [Spirochaetaceae bacterium]